MKTILSIFITPREVFEEIRARPTWASALLFSTGGLFVLVWLGGCWRDFSQALQWSNLLGPALISPLIVGIVSLGTTGFVYLVSLVLYGVGERAPGFRTWFSVNAHCGGIFLLGEVVNFLLARTNLLGEHLTPLPSRFPVGLDLLLLGVDDPDLYLTVVLHSTSVFIVWYLVVLSLGISLVAGISKIRATAVVLMLWCAVVALALGAIYAAGGGTTIRVRI